MADIRSQRDLLKLNPVSDISFSVVSNFGCGFKVDLSWRYQSDKSTDIIGFKIYKANLAKPMLQKNYIIDQRALEKTSKNNNFNLNNLLYNKSLFSQNSKVKFENSNSEKYNKTEGPLSEYSYQFIFFRPVNKERDKNDYSFSDKNIKFGESYIYYISAVTNSLKETSPVPILVNAEVLQYPDKPEYISSSETDDGILLIFGNKSLQNISEYLIFKKSTDDQNYFLADKIEANTNFHYYTDINIYPKKTYSYKIFTKDIWGNVSLTAAETTRAFGYTPLFTSIENKPLVSIVSDNNLFVFRIKNGNPKSVKSIKIERRDDWRFERSFSVKVDENSTNNSFHFFDSSEFVNFTDKLVYKDRAYSYKITCYNSSGFPICYILTPPLKIGDSYRNFSENSKDIAPGKFSYFDIEVINKNERPAKVKFSWKINGDWSYLLIKDEKREIKIDSFHNFAIIDFDGGVKYSLTAEVFLNSKKTDSRDGMVLNL